MHRFDDYFRFILLRDVYIVGQPTFDEATHIPSAVRGIVPYIRFLRLENCIEFLKSQGVAIFGVEILEGATAANETVFPERIAIMLGNEVKKDNSFM